MDKPLFKIYFNMVDRNVNCDQPKQTELDFERSSDNNLIVENSYSDLQDLEESLRSVLRDKRRISAVQEDDEFER